MEPAVPVPGSRFPIGFYTSPVAEAPSVTIPDKPAFKASEVCELAQIQPYVLRSWESEFPELGLSKTPGGPRIYRRTDVERVLRIRDLVFTEGLTLSGVRRRFDAEQPQPQDDLFTFVAEVQAAQAKAAQANAERRTLNAEAERPATPNAERRSEPASARRTSTPKPHGDAARAASAVRPRRRRLRERRRPARPLTVRGVIGEAAAVPAEARATLVQLKQEMRSLLDLLGGDAAAAPPPRSARRRPGRGKRS